MTIKNKQKQTNSMSIFSFPSYKVNGKSIRACVDCCCGLLIDWDLNPLFKKQRRAKKRLQTNHLPKIFQPFLIFRLLNHPKE